MGFADFDIAVKRNQLNFGTAAVDGSGGGTVDGDVPVFAVSVTAVRDDGVLRLKLEVETGVRVTVVGLHLQARPSVGGQADVDVAVQRTERHRLVGGDAGEGGSDGAVHAMHQGRSADVGEGHAPVGAFDLDIAGNTI